MSAATIAAIVSLVEALIAEAPQLLSALKDLIAGIEGQPAASQAPLDVAGDTAAEEQALHTPLPPKA